MVIGFLKSQGNLLSKKKEEALGSRESDDLHMLEFRMMVPWNHSQIRRILKN
jgi:hypothetical protein